MMMTIRNFFVDIFFTSDKQKTVHLILFLFGIDSMASGQLRTATSNRKQVDARLTMMNR